MIRHLLPLLLTALLLGPSAWAQDPDDDDDPDVEEGETITGGGHDKVDVEAAERKANEGGGKKSGEGRIKPTEVAAPEVSDDATMAEVQARPYPATLYITARALGMDSEADFAFLSRCYDGVRMVYSRRYPEAKRHFDAINNDYSGRGVGHVGAVLIYQGKMMENFDFKWDKQYTYHSDSAISELERSLERPGYQAWEHFLIGMMKGVESIHVMRYSDFVPALTKGVDAMNHLEEAKELAPGFVDPLLGDGLFRYWRSVVAMNSKLIPDGQDERAEGIADMLTVERRGAFLGPGATLGLTFTWIEEREMKRALDYCLKNKRAFPDNVINNMVLSRVYLYMRRYQDSLNILDEIITIDPSNERVHYYYATLYVRMKRYDDAERHVDRYLSIDGLSDYHRAQGLHRKGDVYYKRKDWDTAERYYKQAVRADNYKPSKRRLDRIKERRRANK